MISLGIDTSNYTTSAALFDSGTNAFLSERELLQVPEGALGLRQSEAVFQHTVKLPELLERLFAQTDLRPDAVAVSVCPSEEPGSYMPCFLAGKGVARAVAAAYHIPVRFFSHQAGHIGAVLLSAGQTALADAPFYALHLSGGTTDALFVEPDPEHIFRITRRGGSLDLKAGQAIDRVGKLLGLPFPAGKHLDELSRKSDRVFRCKPFFRGDSCSFSGVQNRCEAMVKNGEAPADVANYCISYICDAVGTLTERLIADDRSLPVVFSGGVTSNSMMRSRFPDRFRAVFAEKGLASDNAVGIAWLGAQAGKRERPE